jgi:co-chaperonin GroES (HSP10)
MKILNNKVLILPDGHFNSDGIFEIFDDFEPAKHFSILGTILALPERLVFHGKELAELRKNRNPVTQKRIQHLMAESLEFDNDMGGCEIGDKVAFRFINHVSLMEEGSWLDFYQMGKALLVDFDQLYMRIDKEGHSHMLNGWIMVEPIEYSLEELEELGGGFVVSKKDVRKPGIGIVRMIGTPNRGYSDGSKEGHDVQIGDKVMFRHSNNVSIEWAYHKVLNEGKYAFYRMQRKDILIIS